MNMVRGGPAAAGAAAFGGRAMRVPQAPQNAKPTCTGLPQVGQAISRAGRRVGHHRGRGRRHRARRRQGGGRRPSGARASAAASRPRPGRRWSPAVEVSRGPGVAPASGFGGSWNGMGRGIRGESFHGMPPRGLAPAGEGVRSSPATADARAARAAAPCGRSPWPARAQPGPSPPGRAWAPVRPTGRTPAGAAGFTQLAAATQAKLVVVLIFFAAAVAGDQNDPRSAYGN